MAEHVEFPGKIVVCTDFTEASYTAFPYAVEHAKDAGVPLTILNVLDYPAIPIYPADFIIPLPNEIEAIKREAKTHAQAKIQAIAKEHFLNLTAHTVVLEQFGSAADAIAAYAQQERAGLLVMATHGHGLFNRIMLGSVAERVLRHVRCPLLIVPCKVEGKELSSMHLPYRKILVTTDFSSSSEVSFPIALHESKRTGAALTLGYVVESLFAPELLIAKQVLSSDEVEEMQRNYQKDIQVHLNSFTEIFKEVSSISRVIIEKTYSIPNSIAEYARVNSVDLIIMGARGAGNKFQILGGIVEHLVRQSPCPILVVPPH